MIAFPEVEPMCCAVSCLQVELTGFVGEERRFWPRNRESASLPALFQRYFNANSPETGSSGLAGEPNLSNTYKPPFPEKRT
jgi:hypothetical protein